MALRDRLFKPKTDEQNVMIETLNNLTSTESKKTSWSYDSRDHCYKTSARKQHDPYDATPEAAEILAKLAKSSGKKLGKDMSRFMQNDEAKTIATFAIHYGVMRDYFRVSSQVKRRNGQRGFIRAADTGPASLDSAPNHDSIRSGLEDGIEVSEHLNADIACRHRVVALRQEMIPGNWQKDCNVSQHGNDSNLVLSYYLDQPNEDQQKLLSELTFSNHTIETARDRNGRVHIKVTQDNLKSLAAIRDSWIDTTPTASQSRGRS